MEALEATAAPAAAQPPAPPQLRCLDRFHEAGCTRCAAPPADGTEADYELVGDPGLKNGEKLLKSLLSRTPEWRDRDIRNASALTCDEAEASKKLARVLRGIDTSAALRKRDMLHLARLWHYKSTLWRNRTARRSATETVSRDAPDPPPRRAPAPRRSRGAAAPAGSPDADLLPDGVKRRREAAEPAPSPGVAAVFGSTLLSGPIDPALFIPDDLRADFDAVCRDLLGPGDLGS